MSKSICIKTNNYKAINYIINELEMLNIKDVLYSYKKFKNFNNVIIHYKGKETYHFLCSISRILTYLVLDLFENCIIKNLIASEYFYFLDTEQKEILNSCINTLNYEDTTKRFSIIEESFYEFLSDNKSINLTGFIHFRLFNYIKYLDTIIDICVNKFIIDKEYLEYVNILKEYIKNSVNFSENVHLIYNNGESILLDENKKIIPLNKDVFNLHFLSDITFSSNDYTLNSLLTIIPKKLFIHLIDEEDEFINTLKLIFESRAILCTNCKLCNLYKSSNLHNTIH